MRLEVLIESEKPIIYVLNKPEIYIGSANTNDIVINCLNVSRKHVRLILHDDKSCMVTDMGSTNGTFMEAEKLVPGRRYDLKISNTIRLGDRAFLTLLDKRQTKKSAKIADTAALNDGKKSEDAENPAHEKTRVVSLKELEIAKNRKVQKQREVLFKKKKKESERLKKEKESFQRVSKIAAVWILLGVGIHFGWQSLSDRVKYSFTPMKKEGKDRVADYLVETENVITEGELIPKETLLAEATLMCTAEEEVELCEKLPFLKEALNGLKYKDNRVIIMVEQTPWTQQAALFLKETAVPKNMKDSEEIPWEDVVKVAFLNLVKENLVDKLTVPTETNVYVAFYSQDGDSKIISNVVATKAGALRLVARKYYERLKYSKKMNKLFKIPQSEVYKVY